MTLRRCLISAALAAGVLLAGPVAADERAEAVARIQSLTAYDLASATSDWLYSMEEDCRIVIEWVEFGDRIPDDLAELVFDRAATPEVLRPKLVGHLQNLDVAEIEREFERLLELEFELVKDTEARSVFDVIDCAGPGV